MVFPRRLLRLLPIIAALALLAPACHRAPPPSISPSVASSIPAGTSALAGVDINSLRRSPLYARLPQSAKSMLGVAPGATRLFLAWNGTDLLTLAQGEFTAAPPGFTLIDRHLAAGGSGDALRAAQAQRQSGRTGAPGLLTHAAELAPNRTVWIAAAGDAPLPLAGNSANLGRLLRYTRYATAAARIDDRVDIEATGFCAGPGQARELEEKLRAFVSLLSAATARRPDLAAAWNSVRIETSGNTVRATIALSPELSEKALSLLP